LGFIDCAILAAISFDCTQGHTCESLDMEQTSSASGIQAVLYVLGAIPMMVLKVKCCCVGFLEFNDTKV
jgi:hypothetical protein